MTVFWPLFGPTHTSRVLLVPDPCAHERTAEGQAPQRPGTPHTRTGAEGRPPPPPPGTPAHGRGTVSLPLSLLRNGGDGHRGAVRVPLRTPGGKRWFSFPRGNPLPRGCIRTAVHRRRRGGTPPPPFLPFQRLRLTANILLRRLRCQGDLSVTNLGLPSAGTIGGPKEEGGPSQTPLPPTPSNTSLTCPKGQARGRLEAVLETVRPPSLRNRPRLLSTKTVRRPIDFITARHCAARRLWSGGERARGVWGWVLGGHSGWFTQFWEGVPRGWGVQHFPVILHASERRGDTAQVTVRTAAALCVGRGGYTNSNFCNSNSVFVRNLFGVFKDLCRCTLGIT